MDDRLTAMLPLLRGLAPMCRPPLGGGGNWRNRHGLAQRKINLFPCQTDMLDLDLHAIT